MKTVVVKFNNVNHVRDVADDVSEEEVMRQVVFEKTQTLKVNHVNPIEEVADSGSTRSLATVESAGKGWFKVRLDGKVVSPRAIRKPDAERMVRELNLGTYTAPKPLVIGAPVSHQIPVSNEAPPGFIGVQSAEPTEA